MGFLFPDICDSFYYQKGAGHIELNQATGFESIILVDQIPAMDVQRSLHHINPTRQPIILQTEYRHDV
jgi:hypothetical protein